MEVNEELDLKIISISDSGEGMGMINNRIFFVPGTSPGDFVRIKITKVMNRCAYGKVVEILGAPSNETETGEEEYGGENEFDYEPGTDN